MADGVALRINRDPTTLLPEYTAQHERLFAAMGLMPGSTGLAVRDGKRLGAGLAVSISGDGLSAIVQPGVAVVSHALASGGPYVVAIPAAATRALPSRPGAGQKRIDAVVLDVLDEDVAEKPTTLREANVAVVQGTATSGTPVMPAAGTMQLAVGGVYYDGGNTPTLQAVNPRYTWAAGGVGVVYSQTERDALAAYDGLKVYRDDLAKFQQRRNGTWEDEASVPGAWRTVSIAASTGFINNGTRVRKHGTRVMFDFTIERSAASTVASGSTPDTLLFTLDSGDRPGGNANENGNTVTFVAGNGTAGGLAQININEVTGEVRLGYTNRDIATGHRLRGNVHYYTD